MARGSCAWHTTAGIVFLAAALCWAPHGSAARVLVQRDANQSNRIGDVLWDMDFHANARESDVVVESRFLTGILGDPYEGPPDPYLEGPMIEDFFTLPEVPSVRGSYDAVLEVQFVTPGQWLYMEIEGSDGFKIRTMCAQVTAKRFPGGRGRCIQKIPGDPVARPGQMDRLTALVLTDSGAVVASKTLAVRIQGK